MHTTIPEETAQAEIESPRAPKAKPTRRMTFRDKFCEAFNCPDERFEMEVLERSLSTIHRALFKTIHGLRPRHFQGDAPAISRLGSATTPDEFTTGIECVQYSFRQDHPVLRTLCRTRVSGKRLMELYHTTFPSNGKTESIPPLA